MLYPTLWNIVMAINSMENDSCTLQIVRESNYTLVDHYEYGRINDNPFVEFSMKLMLEKSIPLVVVDLTMDTMDGVTLYSQFLNAPLLFRYFSYGQRFLCVSVSFVPAQRETYKW